MSIKSSLLSKKSCQPLVKKIVFAFIDFKIMLFLNSSLSMKSVEEINDYLHLHLNKVHGLNLVYTKFLVLHLNYT